MVQYSLEQTTSPAQLPVVPHPLWHVFWWALHSFKNDFLFQKYFSVLSVFYTNISITHVPIIPSYLHNWKCSFYQDNISFKTHTDSFFFRLFYLILSSKLITIIMIALQLQCWIILSFQLDYLLCFFKEIFYAFHKFNELLSFYLSGLCFNKRINGLYNLQIIRCQTL